MYFCTCCIFKQFRSGKWKSCSRIAPVSSCICLVSIPRACCRPCSLWPLFPQVASASALSRSIAALADLSNLLSMHSNLPLGLRSAAIGGLIPVGECLEFHPDCLVVFPAGVIWAALEEPSCFSAMVHLTFSWCSDTILYEKSKLFWIRTCVHV